MQRVWGAKRRVWAGVEGAEALAGGLHSGSFTPVMMKAAPRVEGCTTRQGSELGASRSLTAFTVVRSARRVGFVCLSIGCLRRSSGTATTFLRWRCRRRGARVVYVCGYPHTFVESVTLGFRLTRPAPRALKFDSGLCHKHDGGNKNRRPWVS